MTAFHAFAKFEKLALNVTLNRSVIIHLKYIFLVLSIFYSDRIFLQCWCFTLDKELVIQVSSKLNPLCPHVTSAPLHSIIKIITSRML